MLTQRQIRLLMLLGSCDSWMTSGELSERLSISAKLVKQEVAAIREQLGSAAGIESLPRYGYRLLYLDTALREKLAADFDAHEGHHSIKRRYAQVFLMLVLAPRPLSMSQVAERLFVSKATVAEQVQVMRYRMTRLPNLSFEVGSRDGMRIEGAESERRYEASKWIEADRIDAMFDDPGTAERFRTVYVHVLPTVIERSSDLLAAGRISGDDVKRVAGWCALSLVRPVACEQLGERQEACRATEEAIVLAEAIAGELSGQGLGEFAVTDRTHLALLLSELIVPVRPSDLAVIHAVRLLDEAARATRCDSLRTSSEARMGLAIRIDGVLRRCAAGHGLLNYHASETVARYPLASCLASSYLERTMPGHVSKAEAMLITLGLAGAIERATPARPVVLYTDENTVVIAHLRALIEGTWNRRAYLEEVHPTGWREPAPRRAIELATDPSSAILHPRAIVLPALPSNDDLRHVEHLLARRAQEDLARLWEEAVELGDGAAKTAVMACTGRDRRRVVLTVYRTVCVVERMDGVVSRIVVSDLSEPLRYRGKAYRRAVSVAWSETEQSPLELFEVVSQLLLEEIKDMR